MTCHTNYSGWQQHIVWGSLSYMCVCRGTIFVYSKGVTSFWIVLKCVLYFIACVHLFMVTACIFTEAGLVTRVQVHVRTCNISVGDINFWCVSTLLCFWKWYICFFLSHAWMKLLWNLLKYSTCVIFLMVWQRRRSFCWESLLAGWLMSCCSSKRTRPSLKWGIQQLPQAWLNTMAVCLPLSGMEEYLNAWCIWNLFRDLTKVWMCEHAYKFIDCWHVRKCFYWCVKFLWLISTAILPIYGTLNLK